MSTYRQATVKDLLNLLEVERSAFPKERWASEESLRKRLELPQGVTWLAEIDGRSLGFANGFPIKDLRTQEELDLVDEDLYHEGSHVWLLRNVAVDQTAQNRGLGTGLIERQIVSARDAKARILRFTATENLTGFYRNRGFNLVRNSENFHGLPQAVWELSL